MKKRGFFCLFSLAKKTQNHFLRKTRTLARTTKRHKKHTRERRCFPFRLTPLRRRRFLRSERPSRTRACPGARESANDVSLFTRNFVSFFFLFFLISFLPSFGCNKWTREEDEALWMCGPSLSCGVCIESGDRSVRS